MSEPVSNVTTAAAPRARRTRRARRRMLSRLLRPLQAGAGVLLVKAAAVLPEPTAIRFGRQLGRLAFPVDRRRRRALLENLAHSYGDALDRSARCALGQRVYQHLGQLGIEVLLMRAKGLDHFRDRIDFDFAHPCLEGRGPLPIIVSAHLGNWELGASMLVRHGLNLFVVAHELADRQIGGALEEVRRQARIEVVPARNAVAALMKAYAQGRVPGFLMDLRPGDTAVMVPFFGREAPTSPAAALLALRTGAPVLPMFCARTHGGTRFRIFGGAPIVADRSRPFREEIVRITAEISRAIEAAVRAYPEQWMWAYRRWKPPAARDGAGRDWRRAGASARRAASAGTPGPGGQADPRR